MIALEPSHLGCSSERQGRKIDGSASAILGRIGIVRISLAILDAVRRVATVSKTCPNPNQGATGPSLLGTGDDSTMMLFSQIVVIIPIQLYTHASTLTNRRVPPYRATSIPAAATEGPRSIPCSR